jgi:uncharacterized protein
MAIKINDIPPEGLALDLAQKIDLFDKGTASTEFTAKLSIKPTGNGIFHIAGHVQADPLLECSRCLNSFPYHVDTEVSVDLAPADAMATSPEHELDRSELDMEFYRGDEIDPLDFVKEQILISLPMVPIHRSDCKGLCATCGTNLNEADCGCRKDALEGFGAFSALKDLLKK